MFEGSYTAALFLCLHVLIEIALIIRVLLRPHREPASRIAWVVVIIAVPVLGILAYIFLGETKKSHVVTAHSPHRCSLHGSASSALNA